MPQKSERSAPNLWRIFNEILAAPAWALGVTSNIHAAIRYGILIIVLAILALPLIVTFDAGTSAMFAALPRQILDVIAHPMTAFISANMILMILISINRAWSLNEIRREEIVARKIEDTPERLPDLRDEGVFAAIVLVLMLPFWAKAVNDYSCALSACFFSGGGSPRDWLLLAGDWVARAVPMLDFSEVYGWRDLSPLAVNGEGALHLKMTARTLIDAIVIFSVIEVLRIRRVISDAIDSLRHEPHRAALVGSRIVPKLGRMIDDETAGDTEVLKNAAIAIGRIAHPRSLTILSKLSAADRGAHVRNRAVQGLFTLAEEARKLRAEAGPRAKHYDKLIAEARARITEMARSDGSALVQASIDRYLKAVDWGASVRS